MFADGEFFSNYIAEGGLTNYSIGIETEERYRYVESIADDRWIQSDKDYGTTNVFNGTRTALYVNGKPIATNNIATTSGKSVTAYFGTDRLASVRQATNEYGDVVDQYNYDAFGTPYAGNLQSSINVGYTSKPYDATTSTYNYGYRDYSPQIARFTSIDPIRDGSNWFSYTANDPVNFVDLWGLELTFLVDKANQSLTATMNFTVGGVDYTDAYSISNGNKKYSRITTGVVSRFSDVKTDTSRTQYSRCLNTGEIIPTNPTQYPDGTYNITGTKPNPTGDEKYGKTWVTTDANQILVAEDGREVLDGGYQIHLTTSSNTNGCVGLYKENDMNKLIQMVILNEQFHPGTSTITVKGGEKLYETKKDKEEDKK